MNWIIDIFRAPLSSKNQFMGFPLFGVVYFSTCFTVFTVDYATITIVIIIMLKVFFQ